MTEQPLSENRCTNFREDIVGKKDENAWFLERDVKQSIQDFLKEELELLSRLYLKEITWAEFVDTRITLAKQKFGDKLI